MLAVSLGISISKLICKWGKTEWLINIGRNSIVYVCLKQIVIRILNKFSGYISIPILLNHILIFGLSMCILYVLALMFTKTELRIVIGRKK